VEHVRRSTRISTAPPDFQLRSEHLKRYPCASWQQRGVICSSAGLSGLSGLSGLQPLVFWLMLGLGLLLVGPSLAPWCDIAAEYLVLYIFYLFAVISLVSASNLQLSIHHVDMEQCQALLLFLFAI